MGKGGRSISSHSKIWRNSFVLKILTSKPLGLKILRRLFANPAPSAAFRGWGEGGDTPISQIRTTQRAENSSSKSKSTKNIFSRNPQTESPSSPALEDRPELRQRPELR